jgi:glycosyltransferase involved in cell wall biosynthesis
MIRAWAQLGIQVSLVTGIKPNDIALHGLELKSKYCLQEICSPNDIFTNQDKSLARRFIGYWGIPSSHVMEFARIAKELAADVVVVSGLDCLPFLYKISGATRVWYAADEWVLHHLSLVRLFNYKSWMELSPAIVKGLYEWSYRKFIDRIWVVTKTDYRAMRWVTGISKIDIIPNGVDADYYSPQKSFAELPKSLIFWGSLDFCPNIQALEWFCRKVWPLIISRNNKAVFTIMGARSIDSVQQLTKIPGIRLLVDVADLRSEVNRHQIVVLPFISGGGIKNKLLEAAAMEKSIVCSSKATAGLNGFPSIYIANKPKEWLDLIERLWNNEELRVISGTQSREWVCNEHSWKKTATAAINFLSY